MVILIGTFGHFSGNSLGYFNISIYEDVGYDSNMQFILNLISNSLASLGALTSVALSGRMPHRKFSRHWSFPVGLLARYQW